MKTKTALFIRNSWIKIFTEHGCIFTPPASLIPENDPSLLWINAGVAALKQYFRHPELLPARNLVNYQPVIRTSDLDRIDFRSFHQTTFEMLGKFSIGSDFKQETLSIIWKWLTSDEWLNMNPNRLFVTVAWEDKESYRILTELLLIPQDRIFFGTKETNFWDMGDGPVGCNVEFFADLQPKKPLLTKIEELDSKRCVEILNAVFPEYENQNGEYKPLKEKGVDVGGGLDRITMVLQNKKNTFATDLWEPIIQTIKNIVSDNRRTKIISSLDV